jgi:AcrR family transcriptional regulator
MDTKRRGSEAVATKAANAVATKAVATKAVATKAVATKAVATKAVAMKAVPAKAMATKAVAKAMATKAVAKAMATKAVAAKAMATKEVAAKEGYHHGDLRRALLDVVLRMAAEAGDVSEVTLREVAKRAGVSHNAPYRHFEDKDALLAAIATEGFEKLSAALRLAREGIDDDEERFLATGHAYLEFAKQHRGHLVVMHAPTLKKSRTTDLQRAANTAFQVLKDVAFDAQPKLDDVVEARRVGTVCWSFLHGLSLLSGNHQIPPSVNATPTDLADLGLRHLFKSFRSRPRPT